MIAIFTPEPSYPAACQALALVRSTASFTGVTDVRDVPFSCSSTGRAGFRTWATAPDPARRSSEPGQTSASIRPSASAVIVAPAPRSSVRAAATWPARGRTTTRTFWPSTSSFCERAAASAAAAPVRLEWAMRVSAESSLGPPRVLCVEPANGSPPACRTTACRPPAPAAATRTSLAHSETRTKRRSDAWRCMGAARGRSTVADLLRTNPAAARAVAGS